jgi:hypothetical protein
VSPQSFECGCPRAVRECAASSASMLSSADFAALATHLYECEGLSTYRIGEMAGVDRQRVGRVLVRAGVAVKPRGAGRPRTRDASRAALDELMARLYVEAGWTSRRISELTGVGQRSVRERLRAHGVRMRTRGPLNREDRIGVPGAVLMALYVQAELSSSDVGRLLGVSGQLVLRAAHDEGLPVRVGGPEPSRGPATIELVEALYADPLVRQTLARHGITQRHATGPIWERFPVPLPIDRDLAEQLYARCGLGARHIELLTGQPSQTVLRLLEAHGIVRRPAGGRTPFMRRWRAGGAAAGPDNQA